MRRSAPRVAGYGAMLVALGLALLAGPLLACGAGIAPAAGGTSASAPAPAAAAGDASPAAPALVPMRFGLNTPTANITPAWVAKDEGYFAKYGIDAELVPIPGGERIVTALVSGEIPITALASTALLTASLGGADLVFLGSWANQLRYGLYARPEIASVRDLRGRQVATTGRGGINRRAMELALERTGLDPERDVTIIAVGQSTDSLTALLTGAVAATMLTPPGSFRAEDEGMRMLVDTSEYQYLTILSGIAASRGWVAQNEDLARRTLQALAEAIAFARQQKEATKAIIGKYSQMDDAALLERTYNAALPTWEPRLAAPPEALRGDLDALAVDLPAARDARPEQFIDNRFVAELEQSGFFERLYR
jgi:NitT/TauT family transport system substrate-binding protein